MKSVWHRMSKCLPGKFGENNGVSAVIVAIVIFVLVGFAALAIDIGHLSVVRNELQNASDAGALNGARVIYTVDEAGELIIPLTVNTDANAEARDAAIANDSDKSAVEVNFGSGNNADVRRGNWNQDTNVFTESTTANENDPDFVNAIRVTTNRSSATSFLASIFGISSFTSQALAIAYRGYAGNDVEYDQPIVICRDSIVDPTGNFVCTRGRMFNSGGNSATNETSRWTNFSEDCENSADASDIPDAVCNSSGPIALGNVSTNAGTINPAMNAVRDCWEAATGMTEPWYLTLPVADCVTCSGYDPSCQQPTCSPIIGALRIKVVWITENGADPDFSEIPVAMEAYNCPDVSTEANRIACWDSFATQYNLTYLDEGGVERSITTLSSHGYQPQTLYFTPDCEFESAGGPGGEDFNVIARHPVLVQ